MHAPQQFHFDLARSAGAASAASGIPSSTLVGCGDRVQPGAGSGGTTRSWALSALILGALYSVFLALVIAISRSQPEPQPHIPFARLVGASVMSLVGFSALLHLALPPLFLAGGWAALRSRTAGRYALVLASVLGIASSVCGYAGAAIAFTNSRVIELLALHHSYRSTADFSPAQQLAVAHTAVMIMLVMMLIGGLCQVVYCTLLARHMASESARTAMKDA